jgi:hypothetical protein
MSERTDTHNENGWGRTAGTEGRGTRFFQRR